MLFQCFYDQFGNFQKFASEVLFVMESVYILGKYAPALSCQKSSKRINTILIFIHYTLRWIQETIGFVLHKKEKKEA